MDTMANEAILRDRFSNAVDFNCVDGVGIEKGCILKFSGARGVAATSADNDIVVGIAAREKIANDGRTQISVYLDGIFDCVVNDTVAAGDDLTMSGANLLKKYTTLDDEKGYVLGKALEASTFGAVTQVLLNKK
jgi:hypothetical protein